MDELAVVLVGAGALTDAWAPVLRALQPISPQITNADLANTSLAALVHRRRFLGHVPGTLPLPDHLPAIFGMMTRSIADELEKAERTGALAVRSTFVDVWDEHVRPSSQIAVVTTNWDLAIESAAASGKINVSENNIVHLHGDRRSPDRLYLPSESTIEPYRTPEQVKDLGDRLYWTIERLHCKSSRCPVVT